ncbi:tyrosine-type recombinase/integrase [Novosphingobium olei]|uniref:Tyrosine-type recombinase/integrase n=1 Tax=Novosphingobium olei TaxID=2728851 RepID=A0A7Y0BT72_9SPHN|nr:tyrosine-type recombinase/integrase [Novosphingobium olei]NML96165.1 tyrosine-type recombinase/integrase [Novosphingobium olei]
MSAPREALTRYVLMRRGFGYRFEGDERCLGDFVAFMDAANAVIITRKLAMDWITQAKPSSWSNRLSMVRGFARHLSIVEPGTEVLPAGVFRSPKRTRPYIYSEAEIEQMLEATLRWGLAKGINRRTYHCLFGLLAATGMRLGEAIGLERADVDLKAGVLTLRRAKGGKDRLVPLHPTTTEALADYGAQRDDTPVCRKSPWFFVLRYGQQLRPQYPERIFVGVLRQIGLRDPELHSRGPRLHDLRHSFAVNTIVRWYRAGEDVERLLPTLTTYLGHSKVRDTYWYLSACPELMGEAASRLEARWETGS